MSALNIFAQPVGERGSGGKDRGPSIVRIDPAFVVKDQVGAFFQREVSDKYFQPGQSATATVSATAPINEEEEDDDDVIEVAAAQVSLSQVKPKVGLQRGGIQNESHSVLRLQRSSMDAPQPTLIDGTLDYEPLPLVKCEPRATIDAMRPRKFEALDGKKTPVPVPHGTSDLTKEWCTLVFRHKGLLGETETVTKAALKPLGDGEGEFSELVLLTLEVDDGKAGAAPKLNRHLVAKFSPPDMSAIELAQVFGTEAHFYNDTSVEAGALTRPEALYVGYLKQRCGPSYYCACRGASTGRVALRAAAGRGTSGRRRGSARAPLGSPVLTLVRRSSRVLIAGIIMESAAGTKEQPTVCFKRVDGCSSAGHMRLAMRSLARFHARWWQAKQEGVIKPYAHPDNAGGPLPKLPQCIVHTVAVFMFKNGIKALPRCFSSHPKYDGVPHFASEYAQFIKEIRPVIRRRRHAVVRELFKKPFTLVHGDAHTENIFFGPQCASPRLALAAVVLAPRPFSSLLVPTRTLRVLSCRLAGTRAAARGSTSACSCSGRLWVTWRPSSRAACLSRRAASARRGCSNFLWPSMAFCAPSADLPWPCMGIPRAFS